MSNIQDTFVYRIPLAGYQPDIYSRNPLVYCVYAVLRHSLSPMLPSCPRTERPAWQNGRLFPSLGQLNLTLGTQVAHTSPSAKLHIEAPQIPEIAPRQKPCQVILTWETRPWSSKSKPSGEHPTGKHRTKNIEGRDSSPHNPGHVKCKGRGLVAIIAFPTPLHKPVHSPPMQY